VVTVSDYFFILTYNSLLCSKLIAQQLKMKAAAIICFLGTWYAAVATPPPVADVIVRKLNANGGTTTTNGAHFEVGWNEFTFAVANMPISYGSHAMASRSAGHNFQGDSR
jgi:hypothetical protein